MFIEHLLYARSCSRGQATSKTQAEKFWIHGTDILVGR